MPVDPSAQEARDDLYRLASLLGELVRIMDPLPQGSYGEFQVETLPPPPLPPTGIPGTQPGSVGGRAPARSAAEWVGLVGNRPAPRPVRPLPPWVEPPAAAAPGGTAHDGPPAPAPTVAPTAKARPAAGRDPDGGSGSGGGGHRSGGPATAETPASEPRTAFGAQGSKTPTVRAPPVADQAAPGLPAGRHGLSVEPPLPHPGPVVAPSEPRLPGERAAATPAPPTAFPAAAPEAMQRAEVRPNPRRPAPTAVVTTRLPAPGPQARAEPAVPHLGVPDLGRPVAAGRVRIPATHNPSLPRRIGSVPVGTLPPPAPVIAFAVPTLHPEPEPQAPAEQAAPWPQDDWKPADDAMPPVAQAATTRRFVRGSRILGTLAAGVAARIEGSLQRRFTGRLALRLP
ncbi:MAG: hypothetical protein JSS43_31465 [Proteobacteria bacterium]|nr:hypothetical protein [Pseudomonadota bacterium]